MDAEGYTQLASNGLAVSQVLALRLVGHNQRVLEFGCAAGHVTKHLAEQGCSVVGLEIDPDAAEIASAHAEEVLVVDLATDDVANKLAGREFDVALFGDVLEHLADPLSVLRSARQLLAPGTGFVVLSVPNVAHVDVRLALLKGDFEYRPYGLLDETHLRFFTRASLNRLVDEAGYVPVELQRVVQPAFATEVDLDPDTIDPAVLATVLADPEAETYQYVMKLVPNDAASAVADLARRVLQLEDDLRIAAIDHGVELAAAERRAEAADQRAHEAEHRTALIVEEARQAEQVAAGTAAELDALRHTRLFRWSAPARRGYAALRRPRRSSA